MISTLLQAIVEMHPHWGIDREWLSEPARRHRCEICEKVFICHLCTIGMEHKLHCDNVKLLPSTILFVCEICCQNSEVNRFQRRKDGGGRTGYFTDLLLGDSHLSLKTVQIRLFREAKNGNRDKTR